MKIPFNFFAAKTDLQGKAVQEIRVLSGPMFGRCSVQPLFGYEYLTNFKLSCVEWLGRRHGPLFYQLSYGLNSTATSYVHVRYTVNNNIKFVLPAGNPESDYSGRNSCIIFCIINEHSCLKILVFFSVFEYICKSIHGRTHRRL